MAEDERTDVPDEGANGADEAPAPEEAVPEADATPAEEAGAAAAEDADAAGGDAEPAGGDEPAAAADAEPPAADEPVADAEPAGADEASAGDAEPPAADEPAADTEPPGDPEQPAPTAAQPGEPAPPEAPAAPEPAPDETAEPTAGAGTADAQPGDTGAEAGEAAAEEQPRRQRPPKRDDAPAEPEVVPGAHLEPDLVLEERREDAEGEYADRYATDSDDEVPVAEGEEAATVSEQPQARTPLDLAADARYRATGKRKRAVARVILKPGQGTYTINGKTLEVYFPRPTLQKNARRPLETAGYETRMDVVARIHGGGVSSQASALRHGIARALVEADPNLRGDLKRQGFLTRDARVKERKKAGLKKARKRPQFSKR